MVNNDLWFDLKCILGFNQQEVGTWICRSSMNSNIYLERILENMCNLFLF